MRAARIFGQECQYPGRLRYENISQVDAAMEIIKSDGTPALYKGGS